MKNLPRVQIAHLPTRIESLENLSAALRGPKLFVKRDDQTGLAFGGNKTRKLEFLVGEAQTQGAETLITAGALQSNHCRQTAAAAARFGMKCILVLAGTASETPTANFLLDQLLGAEFVFTEWENRHDALQAAFDKAMVQGRKPYLVPYGGSNATGAAGYAFAIQELMAQEMVFDWIVFPTSSGGTQAGMMAGVKLFGLRSRVLGISVDEKEATLKERVSKLATEVIENLGFRLEVAPEDVLVNADYCEAGYGVITQNEIDAIDLFAKNEGLLLDPVYTGRAAGGVLDLIRKGFFSREEKVLFWHTGGIPALFANQYSGVVQAT